MKKLIILLCFLALPAQAQTLYYSASQNQCYSVDTGDNAYLAALPSDVHTTSDPCPIVPPTPTPAAEAAAALASGIVVTSSAYASALNGTYATTPQSILNVNAVVTCILLNGTFCNGSTIQPWADASGTMHTFPTIAEFKAFATQFASYVAAVQIYADSGGTVGSIPSNTITLP